MFSCFPFQGTPSNQKTSVSCQPKSDQYGPAEPTIWPSPLQRIQEPVAAKVASLHRNTTLPQVPSYELTPIVISLILDARIGECTIGLDEVRSLPEEKCLVAQIFSRGGMTQTMLSYREAISLPGGIEAMTNYFAPYNSTPSSLFSTLKSKWLGWGGWFRGRKSQSFVLSETTLWPPYQYPGPS